MVCHGFEFAVDGNFEGNFSAVNVSSCRVCVCVCVCECVYIHIYTLREKEVQCVMSFVWSCTSGLARTAACRLLLVSIQRSEVTVRVSWNFDTANLLCCRETQITGSTALWVPRNCGRTKDLKEHQKEFTQQRQRAIWRLSQRHVGDGKLQKKKLGLIASPSQSVSWKYVPINVTFGSFIQMYRGIPVLVEIRPK